MPANSKLGRAAGIILNVRHLLSILAILLGPYATLHAGTGVSFQRDVAPILQRRCVSCHNEENPKGGYRLDHFAALQVAGDSGAAPVVAGDAAKSELYRLLVAEDSDDRMPQKADALPPEEIRVIEQWVKEGGTYDGGDTHRTLAELVRSVHLRPAPAKYGRPIPVTALAFNGDGRRLAVSGYREVMLWDTGSGTLARRLGNLPERIAGLAWHPQRNLLAIAGGTPGQWGTVALVDAANSYATRFLCDLPELALCVAFTKDGSTLIAGCGDRTLRFFDTSSGKQTRVLRLHADWVQDIAFNPGGTRLVTASRDRTARVLDAADWHQLASYPGHETALLAATFTADGSRIVTSSRGEAHLWNTDTANKQREFSDLGGDIRQLAAGPFGFAAGCADGKLRLYQGESRQPWLVLDGHGEGIHSLVVSRDGALIATGSADGEVILWSPACWAPVLQFRAVP